MSSNNSSRKILLTPKEVAEMLDINIVTVYRLVHSRKISFHKVGSRMRFRKEDVMEYLERNRFEKIVR